MLSNVLLWSIFLHELCHYVPALLLGCNPKIHRASVSIDTLNLTRWKLLIIDLAPSVVGLIGYSFLLLGLNYLNPPDLPKLIYLASLITFAFAWQVSCSRDFINVVKTLSE